LRAMPGEAVARSAGEGRIKSIARSRSKRICEAIKCYRSVVVDSYRISVIIAEIVMGSLVAVQVRR
jgi:hypothetical protein